tara:strand:- start:1046 stop:1714 length:669 start_codon:yes stop_codon:yes gene_type:complete
MSAIIPIAVGALLIRKLQGSKSQYPHTMFDCNTGNIVTVENKEQHDDYVEAGFASIQSGCSLDSVFGRDYGAYDYPDSVDDMTAIQKKWTVVYQNDTDLENIAVYKVEKLSYEPLYERRGYYRFLNYSIGSTDLWANGAPTQLNSKTFNTEEEAVAYYKSIGKQRPTTPSKPEGEPMPEPEVEPVTPNEPTPEPTPTPVNPYNPPSSGFGGNGFNQFSVGGF